MCFSLGEDGRCHSIPDEEYETALAAYTPSGACGKQPNTMATWAQALTNAMNGYRHEFKRQSTSQVNVIILDAATSGRMSICYYDELAGQDFIGRVEKWHLHGMWQQHDYDDNEKKSISFFGVPASKNCCKLVMG